MHDAKWLFPQAGAPKERSLLLGEEEKATLYEPKKVYVDSENALSRAVKRGSEKPCVTFQKGLKLHLQINSTLYQGTASQATEKLVEGLSTGCLVSGHDFSRSVSRLKSMRYSASAEEFPRPTGTPSQGRHTRESLNRSS
jgi:hypothetical protein